MTESIFSQINDTLVVNLVLLQVGRNIINKGIDKVYFKETKVYKGIL